ncbi:MAG: hypothetical protein DRJ61_04415 [Acidobacteria bacterium]|nr:MAG: hypothetical protein DRJ61_04415 [Acidobacteriota bacterium]
MDIQGNDFESQVLRLNDEAKARLAVKLIRSLDSDDSLTRDQVDALWLKEAEDRLLRMESSQDSGVEVSAAISEARTRLRS